MTPPTVSINRPSVDTTCSTVEIMTIISAAQDDTEVSKVEFYDGATLIGTDTTNLYG